LQRLRELYDALPATKARPEGPYTFDDEQRDFWATFGTEAGKRVLGRIAQICDPHPASAHQLSDVGFLACNEAKRWVWREIQLSFAGRGAPAVKTDEEI
jgi:hypothetical protein